MVVELRCVGPQSADQGEPYGLRPIHLLDHEQSALERILLDVRRDVERRLGAVLCPASRNVTRDVLDDAFAAAAERAVVTLATYLDIRPMQPSLATMTSPDDFLLPRGD